MLSTHRLQFRRFTPADLESLHQEIYSHAKIAEALSPTGVLSIHDTEYILTRRLKHWQEHGFGVWALIHPHTQQLLGHCGLHYLGDTTEVELTYAIQPTYWRQGLATEAATAVISWGFEQLNLQQIVAVTGPSNWASQQVIQKLGMRYQKNIQYNGTEVLYYRLCREECRLNPRRDLATEIDLLITSL